MSKLTIALTVATLAVACAPIDGLDDEERGSTESSVSIDRTIVSRYGITTFGGPGDIQSATACGMSGTKLNAFKWYVASSQRYSCRVRLRLTSSNGKCVVVSTEDAGPASWVESKAGVKILDAGPAVAKHLFGVSGIGWSDLKKTGDKYVVTAERTTLPVGPCDASAASTSDDEPVETPREPAEPVDLEPTPLEPAPEPIPDAPEPPIGAKRCASDGACNPGNDGSGLKCEGGFCVAGCRKDMHCPGITRCVSGACR